MTTLGPDYFGHNVRMVVQTEASVTGINQSKYQFK